MATTESDLDSKPVFDRVPRAPTLVDKVSESILATIISQGLKPGDTLPSERELGEQFGVSRTVVREAVRSLAGRGVIEVISGRGLAIASVGSSSVSDSMSLYMRLNGELDYALVHEVRAMIEIEVAGHAAERANSEELAELESVCSEMESLDDKDVEALSRADVRFHRSLAKLTRNPLHLVMLDSIGDVMLEVRRATLSRGASVGGASADHRRIVERVGAGDAEGARKAMSEHLAHSYEIWRESGATLTLDR